MKRLAILISMVLMFGGCLSHQSADSGRTDAHLDSIQRIAQQHKKTAQSPDDVQAFDEIYNEAVMAKTADALAEQTITDLKKQLASAKDTTKLRDSLVWLAPSFLIACCVLFAAWGYFKFRWLEYAAVAAGAISIGSIVLYLAIQTIQSVLVWLVPVAVACGVAYAVYWFIANRKKTTKEMEQSATQALAFVPSEAKAIVQARINEIQSPQTQALVAQAQASS